MLRPQDQTGLRTARGAGKDDPVRPRLLLHELLQGQAIGESSGGAGTTIRDQIGSQTFIPGFLKLFLQNPVPVSGLRPDQLRSQQPVQDQIAGERHGEAVFAYQDQPAGETEAGCSCRRLAAVVGLCRPGCQQGFSPMRLGFRYQQFQLTGFVPAQRQAGLVIALHQQPGASQRGGQARQRLDRRWEMGKT